MHDKGNVENLFDRVDYQVFDSGFIHFNLATRVRGFRRPTRLMRKTQRRGMGWWLQITGLIPSAMSWAHRSALENWDVQHRANVESLIGPTAVFTLGGFVRRDTYNYYPSGNPFADLGPSNLQQETVAQNRTLTNAGARSNLSYVKGINNVKAGIVYEQTFLTENDNFGIVDPTFNSPCLTARDFRSSSAIRAE